MSKRLEEIKERVKSSYLNFYEKLSTAMTEEDTKKLKCVIDFPSLEYLINQVEKYQEQNEQYRKALEFYADKDNYYMRYDSHTHELISSHMFNDEGELARKALKVEVGRSK